MKSTIVQLLCIVAPALLSTSGMGFAQTYPAKPVRIIVGTVAGGPQVTVAMLVRNTLSLARRRLAGGPGGGGRCQD